MIWDTVSSQSCFCWLYIAAPSLPANNIINLILVLTIRWYIWTVMLEKTWESLGLQRDPTSPYKRRSVLAVHWKDWCWSWNSNTLATCCEELTHLKRPWVWERLKAGEGDKRGYDGWMASLTQWTWVWVDSSSWWWTGAWRAVVHGVAKSWTWLSDWTELNWFSDVYV